MNLSYTSAPVPASAVVGTDQTGILEVPVYGTLLPCEVEYIESQELQEQRKPIAQLAEKITKELNTAQVVQASTSDKGQGFAPKAIKLVEVYYACYAWVFGGTTQAHIDLIGNHLNDLNALSDEISGLLDRKSQVYALAILTGRLEQKCTIADLKDPAKIHPGLADRLGTLAFIEERGDVYDEAKLFPIEKPEAADKKDVPAVEETDETLGK
jgi:hypothetical protein